jgi:hypothetical protein
MSIISKYLSLKSVAATPVGEVIDDMGELGAGQIAMTVKDENDRTVGGLILLHGEDADRYMQAIRAVEAELQAEDDAEGSEDG